VKNNSQKEKQIEITSYMELVIDRYDAEASHPAFNKLFIESEYVKENNVLISTRRGGSNNKALYFMHMINKESARVRSVEYECNRMRFIGRNRTLKNPYVIEKGIPLSNDAKFSGDPIASFRVCISVEAGEEACVTFINGLFESKEALLQASDELSVSYKIQDIIQKFRLQSDMELKYLNITGKQLSAFQKIISQIYYPTKHFRGPSESIRRNWKDKNTLWRFMISGDYPILLLSISSINDMQLVKDVLKLYEYMGMNSVEVDLVILAVGNYGYVNELSDMLNSMTSSLRIFDGGARETPGIFILHSYQLNPAEMDLLFTVAKVVFTNETGIFFRNVDLSFSITSTESNFDKEVHLIG
jgi:cellobiose phosphorylase